MFNQVDNNILNDYDTDLPQWI